MKYVGEVTDDSYWDAMDDLDALQKIENMKIDAMNLAIVKYSWTKD